MPRVFVPFSLKDIQAEIEITGDEARYCLTVLRLREGDSLTVITPDGTAYEAEIRKTSKRSVFAGIIKSIPLNTESGLGITLVPGILKGQKMDLVIQKATELGVRRIAPVFTSRSQLTETRKHARWLSIAEEAVRQSGRTRPPEISAPVSLAEFLKASARLSGICLYEERGMRIKDALSGFDGSAITVAIGPEGGFAPAEADALEGAGLVLVNLGERILRAETASIAALAIIQTMIGDMG